MSGIRCYLKPGSWREGQVRLDSAEEHHLRDVLRLRAGDKVVAFDGLGREALAEVDAASGGRQTAFCIKLLSSREVPHPKPSFVLIQSLPKGRKIDLIIEKAVELGVAEIWPVITDRSIVRLDPKQRKEKQERWQKLAISASRQCGANWIPDVRAARSLGEALESWNATGPLMVACLLPQTPPIKKVVSELKGEDQERIGIIIGPEGDLTAEEVRMAIDAGAKPVSFGSQVFRVETAAIFGLSILAYEWGRQY